MNQVGELIRQAIEAMESGANEQAFAFDCAALAETLKKASETENIGGGDYQNFVKNHWRLLCFMGLPHALPLPLNVEYNLTRLFHGFTLRNAEDLLTHLIRQTAQMGKTPAQFRFHSGNTFEIAANQILVPASLVGGLVGIVIFQPVNKGETVPDKYWLNISDFKMFISEFWGRIDLAERVMNFYLE